MLYSPPTMGSFCQVEMANKQDFPTAMYSIQGLRLVIHNRSTITSMVTHTEHASFCI